MGKTPNSKSFWRVFGPILAYLGIMMAAQMIVGFVLIFLNAENIAELLMTLSSDATQAEIDAIYMNVTLSITEIAMKYYVEITTVAALCTVPVTAILFRKDRKNEIVNNIPVNRKAPLSRYILIPILGFAVCFGANCLIIMTNLAFVSESYQEASNLLYSASLPVQILCIGIIVPMTEELLFRGLVFKRFREITGFMKAAVGSTVFFMVIHSSLPQMIYTFLLGILLAYVYEKYGSFKAPVLLHITVNMVSIICTELRVLEILYAIPVIMVAAIVICAFVGAIMFILIQKIDEKPIIETESV